MTPHIHRRRNQFKICLDIPAIITAERVIIGPNLEMAKHLKVLEDLVVSVDLGTEMLTTPVNEHRTKRIILWLVDDIESQLMKAIRTFQTNPVFFETSVTMLDDSAGVREKFTFKDCTLDAIQHSLLSYESVVEDTTHRSHSMKLLQLGFSDIVHEFM